MAVIHLMRHGEPVGGKIFRGIRDDVLTDHGHRQMQAGLDKSDMPGQWQHIYTSPLKRCLHAAELLTSQSHTGITVEPAFAELHFGEWEGKTVDSIMSTDAHRLRLFWQNPDGCTPPGGEPMSEFRKRVTTAWNSLLELYVRDENVLVLTHGGVMRVILQSLLDIPWVSVYAFDLPYAAVVRIHNTDSRVQWDGLITNPDISR